MDESEWIKALQDFNGLLTSIATAVWVIASLVAVGLLKQWGWFQRLVFHLSGSLGSFPFSYLLQGDTYPALDKMNVHSI